MMKPTVIMAVLASSGFLHTALADDSLGTQSMVPPTTTGESAIMANTLQKRDAYTCYGSTNTSVTDCQKIIDTILADKQKDFTLWPNICAVWNQGTCKVRFCAQPYVTRPVNRSGTWLATYITSPILDGCIGKGNMGVYGDNENLNGHAGTYRVWVS
ncbi:uncharacterized protein F4807DRAFT_872 [Annulohypoxylon truncatum]|uniref:uncharacterized protein n=1 Tax=Annulohypoxylon truncatum TaxID=327061 RepID=UPI002007ED0C|nr:uncharacterized protein F4807DRAFT_872 [Annulohypoxylon truncatum]KAI1214521.1 hypothetical protein F4807DRAFT_872 [Annulohypoxylon truncatum]